LQPRTLQVLVVEDEPLVGLLLADMLADLGHQVVNVVHRLSDGLAAIGNAPLDLAILDVNLAGEQSFPIAAVARSRAIPVLYVTGFVREHIPELAGAVVLPKPYTSGDLERAVAAALSQGGPVG
jgi:DNA-binding response OmpR family regulator